MDIISKELDILRAALLQQHAAASAECNTTSAPSDSTPSAAAAAPLPEMQYGKASSLLAGGSSDRSNHPDGCSPAASPQVSSDAARRELAAARAAQEAAEIEVQCLQHSMEALVAERTTLADKVHRLEVELASAQQRAHSGETALSLERERTQQLERSLKALSCEVRLFESQWDEVDSTVKSLRQWADALTTENARLQSVVMTQRERCRTLTDAGLAHEALIARLEAEGKAHAAREELWRELEGFFDGASKEVSDSVHMWQAATEEQQVLREALAESNRINDEWAQRFALTVAVPPLPLLLNDDAAAAATPSSTAMEDEQREEEEEGTIGSPSPEDTLSACLEAKVIDLALSLSASDATVDAMRKQHDALQASRLAEHARVMELQVTHCTSQHLLDPLRAQLAIAQADLIAMRSVVNPLMDIYEQLLEMFMDEAAHSYELEVRLAVVCCDRSEGRVHNNRSDDGLLEGYRGPAASAAPPATRKRRQTFSASALRQMEQKQQSYQR